VTQTSPSPQGTPGPSGTALLPTVVATGGEPTASAPAESPGPCQPAFMAARVTAWDGAAGHRIASVELVNTGPGPCSMFAGARVQLMDGSGYILIDGAPPAASAVLVVAAGGVLTTVVQDGNYCGPAPVPPVTVAIIFPDGLGRVVASPVSAGDVSGVPPCMGEAGSAGDIEMQPWSP